MQMKKFGWNKESLWGLLVSLSIGLPTFVVDVSVIYFSIHRLHLLYPGAVAVGFVMASLFNYVMNRLFVYSNSTQPHSRAMVLYFGIALLWLGFTVSATVFLVEYVRIPNILGISHIYIARSLVGFFVGVVGYIISSIYTFRMRG